MRLTYILMALGATILLGACPNKAGNVINNAAPSYPSFWPEPLVVFPTDAKEEKSGTLGAVYEKVDGHEVTGLWKESHVYFKSAVRLQEYVETLRKSLLPAGYIETVSSSERIMFVSNDRKKQIRVGYDPVRGVFDVLVQEMLPGSSERF